jgi:hypothetical protein
MDDEQRYRLVSNVVEHLKKGVSKPVLPDRSQTLGEEQYDLLRSATAIIFKPRYGTDSVHNRWLDKSKVTEITRIIAAL